MRGIDPTRSAALTEADRLMTICNACRYCEGLCAVFPAMEKHRTFGEGDLNYLANLCHQCGACYSDCQYSPPHEFNVNVPSALSKVRNDSYEQYAWPRAFAGAFARNGLFITLLASGSVAAFIAGFVALRDPAVLFGHHAGDFYKLMPHNAMVAIFGTVFIYAILALTMSLRAFWRDINGAGSGAAVAEATHDAGHLTYLGGGGGGCTSENEKPSAQRRIFHHLTFYGFMFCFASTSVATVYHYALGWHAPYPLTSLPVLLGIIGGVGLLAGPAGLFLLAQKRDPVLVDRPRLGMDVAFLTMLFLTALTGFALMLLRDSSAMGLLLAIHLGVVLGLFLSLPYGKFVHGMYRYLALVKFNKEG
ncbi:MAG: tricarballylate utilization 4Fe-4S protein TcuB [Pseudolabrys sp.]|nr:tricarballylate utilization 4Fe-4S protein TcuB [Pseudolabrys sp.]MDP2295443.1 tricarballylate utilization 4Fe-4S protein TcuB [Pseudolabrys sp.]